MKATGIVRRVEDFGRITAPKEIRWTLGPGSGKEKRRTKIQNSRPGKRNLPGAFGEDFSGTKGS